MSDQSTDETQADTSDLEKQAAEALASAGFKTEDIPAADAPPMEDPQAWVDNLPNQQTTEKHQVEDLIAAAQGCFGTNPEIVAGAAHMAGLEMTDEITLDVMAGHIKSFLATPA